MKNAVCFLVLLSCFSCGEKRETFKSVSKNSTEEAETDSLIKLTERKTDKNPNAETLNKYTGYYVGDFKAVKYNEGKKPSYNNKINICLDSIRGNCIYGHSVVAGTQRPFSGDIKLYDEGIWRVVAKEPGNDKYDGTFTFDFFEEPMRINGYWEANDTTLAVTKRSYVLDRTYFMYDSTVDLPETDYYPLEYLGSNNTAEFTTNAARQFNASKIELKKEDIENMYAGDLEIMRNAIYARHGYSFKNRKMRYFFDRYVPWYVPTNTDVRNELTELEMKNIALIKRYEEHANRYYDVFGR